MRTEPRPARRTSLVPADAKHVATRSAVSATYDTLRATLSLVIQGGLSALSDMERRHALPPPIIRRVIASHSPNSISLRDEQAVNQGAVVTAAIAAVSGSDDVAALTRHVSGDGALSTDLLTDESGNSVPEGSRASRLEHKLLRPFFSHYLDFARGIEWDDVVFATTFSHLERYLSQEEVTWTFQAPLLNLESALEPFDLCHHVSIRGRDLAAVRELLSDHVGEGLGFDASNLVAIASASHFVLVRLPLKKGTHFVDDVGHREVRAAISALRLLAAGSVNATLGWWRSEFPTFDGTPGTQGPLSTAYRLDPPAYQLTPEVASQLPEVFARVQATNTRSGHGVALRRLNQAYERVNPEDRLLDHWIALEALFLPSDRDELSFRASMRIAAFLGRSTEERRELFKQMRESYDVRSKVVHGDVSGRLEAVLANTEAILRAALRKALTSGLDIRQLDGSLPF